MSDIEHLKFSEEHEWIDIDDETATVGITEHAQESLGDIVYVDLPEIQTLVDKDESIGSIESVKAVSDIFIPVSGEITEINNEIVEQPDIVNEDPYGKGWLIKIKVSDISQINELMSYEDYQEFIK